MLFSVSHMPVWFIIVHDKFDYFLKVVMARFLYYKATSPLLFISNLRVILWGHVDMFPTKFSSNSFIVYWWFLLESVNTLSFSVYGI